jgi:hypothetical protein
MEVKRRLVCRATRKNAYSRDNEEGDLSKINSLQ